MLIRIKNAQMAKKPDVVFPYSEIKFKIAQILERTGFIANVEKKGKKNVKLVGAGLLYENGEPKISDIKRISKSSRRIYRGVREIFPVRHGFGIAIYSTPNGLLTDKEARRQKVGGELLFEIW